MTAQDFLLEIGTEELPPKALARLSAALESGLIAAVRNAGLQCGESERFATPRRLAVLLHGLAVSQPDRKIERIGPAVSAAFDKDGKATAAAEGFARSCGAELKDLLRETKGGVEKLKFAGEEKGAATTSLLPAMVLEAIAALPIPKRMRWGSSRDEFVRPVHWIVMLFGKDVVPCTILGNEAGNQTWGHRFHHNKAIKLASPVDYESALEKANVVASFNKRRDMVRELVEAEGQKLNARAVIDDALLDEVTSLVEFPVALTGAFDPEFLEVPSEVLVLTMKSHQKCFCVETTEGKLLPNFIAVSNLRSKDPAQVIKGNERVIRPRLADARFFFDQDRKQSLASRREALAQVTFQEKLGSVAEKSARVAALAGFIAAKTGVDVSACERAAALAKCDLITNMVNEFAELQGLMGCYYARHDGEPEAIARAIDEQYMPRFAGDQLPQTDVGTVLAVAEKLDSITGLFAIGQPPTGSKDPFALRRFAIGLLRILVEKKIDLNIVDAIAASLGSLAAVKPPPETAEKVFEFLLDRFKTWYGDEGVSAETFHSVLAVRPQRPMDFDRRIAAVSHFSAMAEAASLIAANKRVSNILDKADVDMASSKIDAALLTDSAEKDLYQQLGIKEKEVAPLFTAGKYIEAMESLAGLKNVVDNFFDKVLVMAEDEAVKTNRLALLHHLRQLFLSVADISELHGS